MGYTYLLILNLFLIVFLTAATTGAETADALYQKAAALDKDGFLIKRIGGFRPGGGRGQKNNQKQVEDQ